MTLTLRYAARSDRGLVRANNEDSVYAGARCSHSPTAWAVTPPARLPPNW